MNQPNRDQRERADQASEEEPRATFTSMERCTAEDWAIIATGFVPFAQKLPDRILAHLRLLDGDYGGFAVDRLTHSLQTATLALHDIGDTLGSFNHADIAAAMLKPFVSEANHWMVEKHGIFQGYYFFHHVGLDRNMREQFRGHPAFERTALFCEKYDGPAFQPELDTMPLEAFEPMVRRVLAAPQQSIYKGGLTE
jgi:predicted HD phosphohydrolase